MFRRKLSPPYPGSQNRPSKTRAEPGENPLKRPDLSELLGVITHETTFFIPRSSSQCDLELLLINAITIINVNHSNWSFENDIVHAYCKVILHDITSTFPVKTEPVKNYVANDGES
jgi:hypothetical protein